MEKLIGWDYIENQTNCTSMMRSIYCFYMARHAWRSRKRVKEGLPKPHTKYHRYSTLRVLDANPSIPHSLCNAYQCANRAVKISPTCSTK